MKSAFWYDHYERNWYEISYDGVLSMRDVQEAEGLFWKCRVCRMSFVGNPQKNLMCYRCQKRGREEDFVS